MSEAPAVSVVMSVRDGERDLAASLDSVLTQTFSDLELIVVDDGSRDASPEILAGYAAGTVACSCSARKARASPGR